MLKYEYPDFTIVVQQGVVPICVASLFAEDGKTRVDVHLDPDVDPLALFGILLIAARASEPPPHMLVKVDAMLQEIDQTLNKSDTDAPF